MSKGLDTKWHFANIRRHPPPSSMKLQSTALLILIAVVCLIGSCKSGNSTRGGGSSSAGTGAAAQSDDADIKVRVATITKQLSRNGKLPGVLLDARFMEEKVGDGVLGPADFFTFWALTVPASDIPAWRAFLAASPVVNGPAAYAAPKAAAPWWVGAADFGKLELFGPKPLTGWFNGWVGLAPDGQIFIYSFTM